MEKDLKGNNNIKITLIALGCSKNLVDCETMSTCLKNAGYNVINDVPDSDIVVINTCGFIESAKKEAIDTILNVADYKAPNGNVKKIIVSGCLSQRYPEDILKEMPEVDAVLGTAHYGDIVDVVERLAGEFGRDSEKINITTGVGGYKHLVKEREISTEAYAWLKIGEGCLNRCSFWRYLSSEGTLCPDPWRISWRRLRSWLPKALKSWSWQRRTLPITE